MIFVFVDVDECNVFIFVCNVNVDCKNILGLYSCLCKVGFLGDGKICKGEEIYKFI